MLPVRPDPGNRISTCSRGPSAHSVAPPRWSGLPRSGGVERLAVHDFQSSLAREGRSATVTNEEMALAASVVFVGLWSGLLGMLTLVMHPMLTAMSGPDFLGFLRAFLPVARKA